MGYVARHVRELTGRSWPPAHSDPPPATVTPASAKFEQASVFFQREAAAAQSTATQSLALTGRSPQARLRKIEWQLVLQYGDAGDILCAAATCKAMALHACSEFAWVHVPVRRLKAALLQRCESEHPSRSIKNRLLRGIFGSSASTPVVSPLRPSAFLPLYIDLRLTGARSEGERDGGPDALLAPRDPALLLPSWSSNLEGLSIGSMYYRFPLRFSSWAPVLGASQARFLRTLEVCDSLQGDEPELERLLVLLPVLENLVIDCKSSYVVKDKLLRTAAGEFVFPSLRCVRVVSLPVQEYLPGHQYARSTNVPPTAVRLSGLLLACPNLVELEFEQWERNILGLLALVLPALMPRAGHDELLLRIVAQLRCSGYPKNYMRLDAASADSFLRAYVAAKQGTAKVAVKPAQPGVQWQPPILIVQPFNPHHHGHHHPHSASFAPPAVREQAPRLSGLQILFLDGLALLFSFLTLEEVHRARATCKSWKEASERGPCRGETMPGYRLLSPAALKSNNCALKRHVTALVDVSTSDVGQLSRTLIIHAPQLLSLELATVRRVAPGVLDVNAVHWPRLTSLRFACVFDANAQIVLQSLARVVTLTSLAIDATLDHLPSDVLADRVTDVHLTVSLAPLQRLPALSHFQLKQHGKDGCVGDRVSAAQVAHVAQMPALTSLSFGHAFAPRRGGGEQFQMMAPFAHSASKQLTRLDLSGCDMSASDLKALSVHLPTLRELAPRSFTEAIHTETLAAFRDLHTLSLSHVADPVQLHCVANTLTHLHLSKLPKWRCDDFESLARSAPRLRSVEFASMDCSDCVFALPALIAVECVRLDSVAQLQLEELEDLLPQVSASLRSLIIADCMPHVPSAVLLAKLAGICDAMPSVERIEVSDRLGCSTKLFERAGRAPSLLLSPPLSLHSFSSAHSRSEQSLSLSSSASAASAAAVLQLQLVVTEDRTDTYECDAYLQEISALSHTLPVTPFARVSSFIVPDRDDGQPFDLTPKHALADNLERLKAKYSGFVPLEACGPPVQHA